ncbi:MAG: NAD(P)/FAD-dependent oxidoreductase [Candidatus Helarchaeota archaeon]|nr:NAD(P)/FAD-dependent oxidoreductase [Candidatus Helarchaeota archaeon]
MQRVVIIGAGSAGLFAAYKLMENKKLEIKIIDKGPPVKNRHCELQKDFKYCSNCEPCRTLSGVGGAGLFSSALLNLNPEIGGELTSLAGSKEKALEIINYIDNVFVNNGAPKNLYQASKSQIEEIQNKANLVGIHFIPITQRHIGTENTPKVIGAIQKKLEDNGIKFILNTEIDTIKPDKIITKRGKEISYNFCLAAPGRSGMAWLSEQMNELGVETRYEPLDVGVRIEVPSTVMDPICSIARDPKFHIFTPTYDDFVRTFCVNHQGFVVQEVYGEKNITTNGHSFLSERSNNTNFALLVKISLTEPLEDTTAYGETISFNCATLGGGKPLIQRLGDIRKNRRSKWSKLKNNFIQPTLKNVTPGDISMALPHRIFIDIIEALEKLDKLIPGVANNSTLLYAPELKYSAKRVITNHFLETSVNNLFMAGDGAGLTRGIVAAALSGLIAAEGILNKCN